NPAAAATLAAVLRLAPDHIPALRQLEALSGSEGGPDALQPLERATVAGSPSERLAARLRLAHALLAAGHLDRAAAVAESALELGPEGVGALLLLGHTRAPDPGRRGVWPTPGPGTVPAAPTCGSGWPRGSRIRALPPH